MGVFGSVVEPVPALVFDVGQHKRKRSGVAAKPVRDHGVWQRVRTPQQMMEEALCSGPIPPRLYENIDDDAVLINGSPEVMNRSIQPYKHFIYVPTPAKPSPARPQSSGKLGTKLTAPQADCFVADDHALGSQ